MIDMQDARDKLADALWWMRGFAASAGDDSVAHDLAAKLLEVRAYLGRVQDGDVRRLGEENAVVIRYAEYERLVDAVHVPRLPEIESAKQTVERIRSDYNREAERAAQEHNANLPF